MKIQVLTLFPAMFEGFCSQSIIKRAIGKGVVDFSALNIRDFTKDKYGRVDTPPIGGGAGLIEKVQPIVDALKEAKKRSPNAKVLLFSPRGETFQEKKAKQLSKEEGLILICGHYEGVDERVNEYVDELLSIGDYILTGGEIPAMAVSDAVIRLLDGAIAEDSLKDESFNDNLLEYPQYTEPYDYEGKTVPDLLYSGNHEAIRKWRRREALLLTKKHRPDLISKLTLSKEDKKLLEEEKPAKWELEAMEKGKKFLHHKD